MFQSVLDIYHAVFAEAMLFGTWYYGTVSLSDVNRLVEEGVQKGMLHD